MILYNVIIIFFWLLLVFVGEIFVDKFFDILDVLDVMIVDVFVFLMLVDVVIVIFDVSDVVGVVCVCFVEGNNFFIDDGKIFFKYIDIIEVYCYFEYWGIENVVVLIWINVIMIIIDDKILSVKFFIIMRSVY